MTDEKVTPERQLNKQVQNYKNIHKTHNRLTNKAKII